MKITNNDKKEILLAKDYLSYLSLLSIEKANSGHPGLPLGCSLLSVVLHKYFLNFNPDDPHWLARDRFVLSAGHGSMLLYGLNYLSGSSFTLKDLASFRQLNSNTPGHPEFDLSKRIETTTGPLGQGFANAVGIALESKLLQSRFKKFSNLFNFNVFTLLGDGCMMEGVTQEAASLAANLKINNLIAIYDQNNISIDGNINIAFSENIGAKFKAYGWEVFQVNGNDLASLVEVFKKSVTSSIQKPKLIIAKTRIGEGLNQLVNSSKAHGSPAGLAEIAYFIKNSTLADFFPNEIEGIKKEVTKQIQTGNFLAKEKTLTKDFFDLQKKIKNYQIWEKQYSRFLKENSFYEKAKKILTPTLRKKLVDYKIKKPKDSTRNIASEILQLCAEAIPQMIGGSADLVASTKATIKSSHYLNANDFSGRNIAYGVREHAMAAINNGLALNGTFIPFSSTFFSFYDYLKPSLRLSAISELKHLFIFSHDSVQVGEDGPTHQPIEQLNSLRLVPNHYVFRPATAREVAFSFMFFLENNFPVSILTTRQDLAATCFLKEKILKSFSDFKKGAYELSPSVNEADIILLGSGSEIGTLLDCQEDLLAKGISASVVSIPCLELFEKSSSAWKKTILADFKKPIFLLEATSYKGFASFFSEQVHVQSINQFGFSGPKDKVLKKLEFNQKDILKKIVKIIQKNKKIIKTSKKY